MNVDGVDQTIVQAEKQMNPLSLEEIEELKGVQRCNLETDDAYVKVSYDLDGGVTGLSGLVLSINSWTDSALTVLIQHEVFTYNSSGLVISAQLSCVNEDGSSRLIQRAFEYTNKLLDNVIQDVTRP